jgi:hypothetical protein
MANVDEKVCELLAGQELRAFAGVRFRPSHRGTSGDGLICLDGATSSRNSRSTLSVFVVSWCAVRLVRAGKSTWARRFGCQIMERASS